MLMILLYRRLLCKCSHFVGQTLYFNVFTALRLFCRFQHLQIVSLYYFKYDLYLTEVTCMYSFKILSYCDCSLHIVLID